MTTRVIDELVTVLGFRLDPKGLENAQRGLRELNRRINNVSRNLAIGGAALTTALFGVGRTVLGFEQTMNNLQAVLNASAEDMTQLRDQAREFGSSTVFSASQVGEAQTELALIFGDLERTVRVLPDVLNLASAGQLEMGETAKLVGNQMNAFGLTVDDTKRITDVLAKAASSGATTVRELGPAFRQVAPLAKTAGLSIEQTTAFIVALRDIGLQAEQSGTALRSVLARLTEPRPPQDFLDALDSINVRFEDLKGLAQRGDYEEIFRQLGAAEIDAASSLAIFGTEAVSAGANLATSINKVEALTESLIGAEGWAERMRLVQEQGLPGAVAAFKSALEGLQLELGNAGLTGWIAMAADSLRGLVMWLRNSEDWVKTTIAVVLAAGPVLLGLALAARVVSFALGGLTVAGQILHGVINLLTPAWWRSTAALVAARVASMAETAALRVMLIVDRLVAIQRRATAAVTRIATAISRAFTLSLAGQRIAMIAGAIATGVATAATWAFNIALLANPIGLIIAAIVGLVAGLAVLVWKVDAVRNVFVTVWDWIKSNWPLLAGILLGPFGPIFAVIWKFRDQIMGFLTGIFNWLKNTPIFGPLIDWAQQAIGWVKNLFGWVGKIGEAFGWVKGALGFGGGGGEGATPTPEGQAMLDFANGLAAGPAMLPTAPPGAAVAGPVNRSVTVEIGEIVVNAPGADSREIAENVREQIRAELRDLVISMDSAVAR